jgi:hypothetical protein
LFVPSERLFADTENNLLLVSFLLVVYDVDERGREGERKRETYLSF